MARTLNFIQRFFNPVIKTALSQLTLQEWVNSIHGTNANVKTPEMALSKTSEIIQKNAWVYACIRTIVNKTRSIEFSIVDSGDKVSKKAMDYFLENINPVYTWNELMGFAQSWKELRGSAIFEIQKDKSIDILHMDYVTVDGDKLTYRDPKNNQERYLDFSKICIDRNYSPYASLLGMTALYPAAQMINVEYSVMNTTQNAFKNGAYIPSALTTDQPLQPETVDEMSRQYNEKYTGTTNSGKTPVLHSGMHLEKIGLTPADYQLLQYIALSKNLIATVIGVPGILINDMEQTDFANAKKQEEIFTRYTLIPKLIQIEATFNRFLLPKLGFGGLKFDFAYEALPELQADEVSAATAAEIRLRSGQTSQDEEREARGLPSIKNGNKYYIPMNWQEIGMKEIPLTSAQAMGKLLSKLSKPQNTKKITPEKANQLYELYIKRMDPQWRKYKKELEEYFKKQFKGIRAKTEEHIDKIINSEKDFESDIIEAYLMDIAFQKRLQQMSYRYIQAYIQQAGDALVAEYGLNIMFDVTDKRVIDYLKTHTIELSDQVYGTTKQDVSEAIRKALLEGISHNESQKELADRILSAVDELIKMTPERAELIARTETARANNKGSLEAAKQGQMRYKTWWHGGGGREPREWHVTMTGETVGIDEPFSHGYMMPGDGPAEEVCNCTCYMTFGYNKED